MIAAEQGTALYLPDGEEMKPEDIEKYITPIWNRLERSPVVGTAASPGPRQTWLQRNSWLPGLITALFGSSVLIGIVVHIESDLDSRIDTRIEQKFKDHHFDQLVSDVDQMKGQLKSIDDDVKLILAKSIKQAALLSIPQFKEQLPQVNDILNAAMQNKAPLDPVTIRSLDQKLLPLVKNTEPQAWQTMVTLASYNSLFNQNPFLGFAVKPITGNDNGSSHYDHGNPPPGDTAPTATASAQAVTKDSGAWYAPIGADDNSTNTATNAFVTLNGGGVTLDGYHVRNIVFVGVHVVYNGGPLILDSAIFINCRFTIQQTRSGEQFVARSFDSEKISFTAGG